MWILWIGLIVVAGWQLLRTGLEGWRALPRRPEDWVWY